MTDRSRSGFGRLTRRILAVALLEPLFLVLATFAVTRLGIGLTLMAIGALLLLDAPRTHTQHRSPQARPSTLATVRTCARNAFRRAVIVMDTHGVLGGVA